MVHAKKPPTPGPYSAPPAAVKAGGVKLTPKTEVKEETGTSAHNKMRDTDADMGAGTSAAPADSTVGAAGPMPAELGYSLSDVDDLPECLYPNWDREAGSDLG